MSEFQNTAADVMTPIVSLHCFIPYQLYRTAFHDYFSTTHPTSNLSTCVVPSTLHLK